MKLCYVDTHLLLTAKEASQLSTPGRHTCNYADSAMAHLYTQTRTLKFAFDKNYQYYEHTLTPHFTMLNVTLPHEHNYTVQ